MKKIALSLGFIAFISASSFAQRDAAPATKERVTRETAPNAVQTVKAADATKSREEASKADVSKEKSKEACSKSCSDKEKTAGCCSSAKSDKDAKACTDKAGEKGSCCDKSKSERAEAKAAPATREAAAPATRDAAATPVRVAPVRETAPAKEKQN